MYYILENKIPILTNDTVKWALWMSDKQNKIVEQTIIKDTYISTVFLGIDHSFKNNISVSGQIIEDPILFETMVFDKNDESYCERYSAWEDAVQGHQKAVEKVKIDFENSELIKE